MYRRDLLKSAAFFPQLHQHVEEVKKQNSGTYKPKVFTEDEWKALRRLCDLIIPKDDVSAGALEAGAPEFIDLLASGNKRLATIFTGGLGWLNHQTQTSHGKAFADCSVEQQTALLDQIAYRKNESPELAAGIRFFDWARRMTVDAFYTSKIGIEDIGFKGNNGMAKFQVPAEAIQYALNRSPK